MPSDISLSTLPPDWRERVVRTLGCNADATHNQIGTCLGLANSSVRRALNVYPELRVHVEETRAFFRSQLRAGALLHLHAIRSEPGAKKSLSIRRASPRGTRATEVVTARQHRTR